MAKDGYGFFHNKYFANPPDAGRPSCIGRVRLLRTALILEERCHDNTTLGMITVAINLHGHTCCTS